MTDYNEAPFQRALPLSDMLKAIRDWLLGSDEQLLLGAQSELRRVEGDLDTLSNILSAQRDSFHNALAESTAHQDHLRERQAKLKARILELEERLASK